MVATFNSSAPSKMPVLNNIYIYVGSPRSETYPAFSSIHSGLRVPEMPRLDMALQSTLLKISK